MKNSLEPELLEKEESAEEVIEQVPERQPITREDLEDDIQEAEGLIHQQQQSDRITETISDTMYEEAQVMGIISEIKIVTNSFLSIDVLRQLPIFAIN